MIDAAAVKEKARALGFDLVGIARAAALGRDGAALAAWLARGLHASMGWMARGTETRADPRRVLPSCRSVIALAVDYGPGADLGAEATTKARVAFYARARDYHTTMGRAARDLASWVGRESGEPAQAFVDTGPILERAWAERAGLGWIGKNANLVSRTHGSWLLLAEVLAVAALEPDEGPHADFCGTCTACLDACPTGALIAPGVLDANLCISHHTIEQRGPVPVERREGTGDWIFGCDVCQEVCPWNRTFAREGTSPLREPRPDLAGLDPAEILAMDEATFRRRFSGTPLMRARWDGMRRNACLVLGNRRDRSARTVLVRALEDSDPTVRSHAAWALERISSSGP